MLKNNINKLKKVIYYINLKKGSNIIKLNNKKEVLYYLLN